MSCLDKRSKKNVKKELSEMIFKIWVAADCLPKVVNSIVRSIDKLLSTYWQYRSGRGRQSGRKERTSDLPVAQSIRRSQRLNRDTTVRDQETLAPADQSSQAAPALEDNEYYLTSEWPPKVLDHLAAIFSDGFYIGEVLKVLDDETARVSYMAPKKILTADTAEHPQRF